MKRTIIIRRDYLHYIRKYQRCVLSRSALLFCVHAATWQCPHFEQLSTQLSPRGKSVARRRCFRGGTSWTDKTTLNPCRYEKRHKNLAVHLSPCFRVKEGDKVVVGQCRSAQSLKASPLSP